jgi:hypothetical protein
MANGGEQRRALVQATAFAICQGGGMATAFAQATSVAITINPNGCAVLQEATATAFATCNGNMAFAFASTQVQTVLLDRCNLSGSWWTRFGHNNNSGNRGGFSGGNVFAGVRKIGQVYHQSEGRRHSEHLSGRHSEHLSGRHSEHLSGHRRN